MFAGGGGFEFVSPTLASTLVVVGGLSRRPRVVGDEIALRDVLDLTVTIDHNVVDGAPATRFGADLPLMDGTSGRRRGRRHVTVARDRQHLPHTAHDRMHTESRRASSDRSVPTRPDPDAGRAQPSAPMRSSSPTRSVR
jgi:hypothetical protein